MSYCRYAGTCHELSACLDDVEEHINKEAEYEVSESEIDYFTSLVRLFYGFMVDNGLIDYDSELNEGRLAEIAETMKHRYDSDYDDDDF
jgi:hypothetical protein